MYASKTRCKHYDSEGNLASKFHDQNCRFVHPDSPAWATASPSPNFANINSNRPPPRRRSEFSQSAWAPDAPGTSTNTIPLPQSSRYQGNAGPSKYQAKMTDQPKDIETSPTANDGVSWSNLMKDADTGDNAWGSAPTPAWGSSSQALKWGETGGWGETGKKEAPNASSSAVPEKKTTGNTGGGWGDAWDIAKNEDKGKGKETDVIMRDPTPPPTPADVFQPVPSQNQTKKHIQDLPRINSNVKADFSFFSPTAPIQPLSALYNPLSATSTSESAHLVSGTLDLIRSGDLQKISNSRASTPVSMPSASAYQGFEGRVKLVKDEVVFQLEAIIHTISFLRAQVEDARWKKTQASEHYERPTPRARDILEAHRKRFATKVDQAKKSRDRALKRLYNLPELPSITDKIKDPARTEELVLAYTSELKEWFEDLELHKRILLEKAANEENIEDEDDGQHEDISLRLLLEQAKWTWKELQRAISLLGTAITNTEELIYEKAYTKADEPGDLEPMLSETLAPIESEPPLPDSTDELNQLEDNIDTTGQKIEGDADLAGELILKISTLNSEIEELRSERMRMDSICIEAEKQLAEFDQRTATEDTEIRELTEMVKNLHLHKRPSKAPTSFEIPPAKMEDIIGHIRPLIIQHIKDDLDKISEHLRLRCKENQDSVADEVDIMLKPVLAKTEEILTVPVPTVS